MHMHVRRALEQPNYYDRIAAGLVPGAEIIHKFGHSANIGTSPTPVAHGEIYPTPQVAGLWPCA